MSPGVDLHTRSAAYSLSGPQLRHPVSLNHDVLLGLLSVLGILAFLFSAASPDDDDIQQEFVQGSKTKQFAVANRKIASGVRTFHSSTVQAAPLPPVRTSTRYTIIERISIRGGGTIDEPIFGSRTGDRSPPAKSS
jgi:hypothetical protein